MKKMHEDKRLAPSGIFLPRIFDTERLPLELLPLPKSSQQRNCCSPLSVCNSLVYIPILFPCQALLDLDQLNCLESCSFPSQLKKSRGYPGYDTKQHCCISINFDLMLHQHPFFTHCMNILFYWADTNVSHQLLLKQKKNIQREGQFSSTEIK